MLRWRRRPGGRASEPGPVGTTPARAEAGGKVHARSLREGGGSGDAEQR